MNPITIYTVFNLAPFDEFAQRIVGGPVERTLGGWGHLAVALMVVALVLAFTRFLYQRKIFLRL